MSARRLPLAASPRDGTAVLEHEVSHHAVRVLRLRPGDPVVLFDGAGGEWDGTVTTAVPRAVRVAVGERRAVPRARPAVDLLTALPKGKRLAVLLRMATEAGVDRIRPVRFDRSAVRGAGESRRAARERRIREAARQSGRAWTPEVGEEETLADVLAAAPAEGEVRLVASTTAAPGLAAVLATVSDPARVAILIGPEGGLSAAEESAAIAAGFHPCSLGPHVLRVETAAVAAVLLVRAATSRGSDDSAQPSP